jgi:hypothetical protein
MKRNILFLLSVVLFSSFELMAQVGQPWLIGGNNLSANRPFGSNNNFGIGFKTNNIQRGAITNSGFWGIGNGTNQTNIAPYSLKLRHGNFGLDILNNGTGNDWEIVTFSNLNLYFNGDFRGSFSSANGAYTPISDERLKTNIQPMSPALEKINQLKPSSYQIKNRGSQVYDGLIAQDVMKVYPSLVTHIVNKERNLDVYTLDYGAIGVIAIKGIQELQQTIKDQEKTITTLEDRITKLEAALNAVSNNLNSKEIGRVSLQQNQPNPFSQATIIRYVIPQGANAQIRIYDAAGNMVKTMRATENGQAQINANELNAGTYTYTLVVNGNVAASKKMVLLK